MRGAHAASRRGKQATASRWGPPKSYISPTAHADLDAARPSVVYQIGERLYDRPGGPGMAATCVARLTPVQC